VTSEDIVKAIRALEAVTVFLPPEAGRPAAVALQLAADLVAAGHGDPAGMIQVLRESMQDDWRAELAGKFTG
jgi:hypothetical protein